MFITGLGTAVPPQCYAQQAGWEAFAQSTLFHRLQPRSRAIIRKVLNASSGIATRRGFSPGKAPLLETKPPKRARPNGENNRGKIDPLGISLCGGSLSRGLT